MFRNFIHRALNCKTVQEFETLLREFAAKPWTIEEKAVMSAVYTPRVVQLLSDKEEKHRRLEEFAALCWRPTV